jgi:3-hydroxyanthranilate 3,4-dioxygenase
MMQPLSTLNFKKWIDENRSKLKPPVGNAQIWEDREFMVTVVAGPNAREDYHYNEGEEFFYQLEGDITLKLLVDGKPQDLAIREGDIFLLPAKVPHSPQRPANTLGLVIERRRLAHEKDGLIWICKKCSTKLYEEYFHLDNIVTAFGPVFKRFYSDSKNNTCSKCGTVHEPKS